MREYFKKLNDVQKNAVMHTEGPVLVIAGAGSGKTSVLTARIAHLIDNGVPADSILAITFTNKAAGEMKTRVQQIVGNYARMIWISTFHSFCVRLLRQEIDNGGIYSRNFVIYDESECEIIVKECLRELNYDDKRFKLSYVRGIISRAKNEMQTYKRYQELAVDPYEKNIGEIFELYTKKLIENNALDFDDLLLITVDLLKNNNEVLNKYQNKFSYILVDEYQDTNHVQYLLTKMLAKVHHNIFVVGDVDQSIYGWRGADIINILDFEKDYPEVKIISLEQNYRSTQVILDAANCVIKNNTERRPKNLWTEQNSGEKVISYNAIDERDEADFIVRTIREAHEKNEKYQDCAVLYRANSQSRAIEEGFLRAGIPYSIVGGYKFYERKEIRDIIAYLKLLYNQSDSISLQRVINVPRRGIGGTSMKYLRDFATNNNISLFEAASRADEINQLTGKARTAYAEFSLMMFKLAGEQGKLELPEFIDYILRETGCLAELELTKTPDNEARVENLKEFIGVARDFIKSDTDGSVAEFLTHIALVTDLDKAESDDDRVRLMTIHSAKGLEFSRVFIAGMEEGLFPHVRTLMNDKEIEEERRLCYVGITRAMKQLYLLRSRVRSIFGQISINTCSRFIEEIDNIHLEESEGLGVSWSKDKRLHTLPITAYAASTKTHFDGKEALLKKSNTTATSTWRCGDKIVHSEFGNGTVVEVKGEGAKMLMKAVFPGLGIKSLMAKYAPIKKI